MQHLSAGTYYVSDVFVTDDKVYPCTKLSLHKQAGDISKEVVCILRGVHSTLQMTSPPEGQGGSWEHSDEPQDGGGAFFRRW